MNQLTVSYLLAIAVAKIFVTGLSLGTGIVGGHFWGPLFVGCAASHFLTGLVLKVSNTLGVTSNLSAYPCVA
jgi:H+/Cl- antiporter ClcA